MAQKPEPRSRYAEKYGVLQEEDPNAWESYFITRGKSGFTPVSPVTIAFRTVAEQRELDFIETAQRLQMYGFTGRELEDMSVYPDEEAQPSSLTNPIMPFFEKQYWVNGDLFGPDDYFDDIISNDETGIDPQYAAGNDTRTPYSGKWTAHNPVVWDILLPILRLATRFLDKFHTLPWTDAYLFGDWRQLHSDGADWPHRYSFHKTRSRTTPNDDRVADAKKIFFQKLLSNIEFGIESGDMIPRNMRKQNSNLPFQAKWLGLTSIPHDYGPNNPLIHIFLSWSSLKHFLRPGLSVSEILCEQFSVALTLVHEIGHAFNIMAPNRTDRWQIYDPLSLEQAKFLQEHPYVHYGPALFNEAYYEDEVDVEMGLSLENAILGGKITTLSNNIQRGALALFLVTWPSKFFEGVRDLKPRGEYDTQFKLTPIMSKYYEYIARDEFWDTAANHYGLEFTRPRATTHYMCVERNPETQQWGPRKVKTERQPYLGPVYNRAAELVKMGLEMTPEEQKAYSTARQIRGVAQETYRHQINRQEQQLRAQRIWRTYNELGSAWSSENENEVLRQQRSLLRLYEQEAEFQSHEIIRCASKAGTISAESLVKYRTWLLKINRDLRSLVAELALEVTRSQQVSIEPRLRRLEDGFRKCHMALHVTPLGPYESTDAALLFYSPQVLVAEDATEAQKSEAGYTQALIDAENARLTNEAKCQTICLDMIWDLGLDNFSRALFCSVLGSLEIEKRRMYFAEYGLLLLNKIRSDNPSLNVERVDNAIAVVQQLIARNVQRAKDEVDVVGAYIPPCSEEYDQGLPRSFWRKCNIFDDTMLFSMDG